MSEFGDSNPDEGEGVGNEASREAEEAIMTSDPKIPGGQMTSLLRKFGCNHRIRVWRRSVVYSKSFVHVFATDRYDDVPKAQCPAIMTLARH